MEMVVLTYGILTSFVLSGASRNRREGRPNPRMMEWVGQILFGFTLAIAVGLVAMLAVGMPIPETLVDTFV